MKNSLIFSLLFLSITLCSAQKVKIKKGIVLIDKKEYAQLDREYGNDVLKTRSGTTVATFKSYSYDKPNPAHYNRNDPYAYKYPKTIKSSYYEVSFVDFDIAFETDLVRKKLLAAFLNEDVLNWAGEVSEANARKLARLIGKDISANLPSVILTR